MHNFTLIKIRVSMIIKFCIKKIFKKSFETQKYANMYNAKISKFTVITSHKMSSSAVSILSRCELIQPEGDVGVLGLLLLVRLLQLVDQVLLIFVR